MCRQPHCFAHIIFLLTTYKRVFAVTVVVCARARCMRSEPLTVRGENQRRFTQSANKMTTASLCTASALLFFFFSCVLSLYACFLLRSFGFYLFFCFSCGFHTISPQTNAVSIDRRQSYMCVGDKIKIECV